MRIVYLLQMVPVGKDKALTAASSELGSPLRGEGSEGVDRATDQPTPGDPAQGHGLSGKVALLRGRQPLAGEGIWRVSLDGECVGRLVRRPDEQGANGQRPGDRFWQLLQIDDLTDEQLQAYESAMQRYSHHPAGENAPLPFPLGR